MKFIFVILIFVINCVSSTKYEELKTSCELNEKKIREELGSTCKKREEELLSASKENEKKLLASFSEREAVLNKEFNDLKAKYSKVKKERGELKNSVSDMEKALEDLNRRKQESDARIAEFQSLLAKFKNLIDSGKLKVKILDGRMVVVLSSDVLFASGSRELSTAGKKAIEEVAEVLAEIPERKFQIEGHTDSDRYRVYGLTNWELAAFRALNVLHTMVESGMKEDKISAASFGASRPVVENNSNENKKLNRRIEIVVVPDLSLLPGFEELQKLEKE